MTSHDTALKIGTFIKGVIALVCTGMVSVFLMGAWYATTSTAIAANEDDIEQNNEEIKELRKIYTEDHEGQIRIEEGMKNLGEKLDLIIDKL